MAGNLGDKKQCQLARLIEKMLEQPPPSGGALSWSWHKNFKRHSKQLVLGLEGFYVLREAVGVLQSVEAWNQAYPFDVLSDRIVHSLFEPKSAMPMAPS